MKPLTWTTPEMMGKDKFFLDSTITMFPCVGGLAICSMAMNCNFHRLAMNDIKGPKLRVQISPLLAPEDADDIAPAIARLKNYPGESIDISKLSKTVNAKRIVHLSQTQEEGTYDAMFNDLADELRVAISGPVLDIT